MGLVLDFIIVFLIGLENLLLFRVNAVDLLFKLGLFFVQKLGIISNGLYVFDFKGFLGFLSLRHVKSLIFNKWKQLNFELFSHFQFFALLDFLVFLDLWMLYRNELLLKYFCSGLFHQKGLMMGLDNQRLVEL